jgi:hypothetical protein
VPVEGARAAGLGLDSDALLVSVLAGAGEPVRAMLDQVAEALQATTRTPILW